MRVDVDGLVVEVGQGLQGAQKREGCLSVAREDMVVITLPVVEVIPVKEPPDGLRGLLNDSCCSRLTVRMVAEGLFFVLRV